MTAEKRADIVNRITQGFALDSFADGDMLVEGIEANALGIVSEETISEQGEEAVIQYLRINLERLVAIRADRSKHPEIAEEEIKQPVFILGAPRTGTTFLHNLLAMDPGNRSPLGWEAAFPSPPPESSTYATDPRIQQWVDVNMGEQSEDFRDPTNAEINKKHTVGALKPEECGFLMACSMRGNDIWGISRGMSYMHWMLACDMVPAYRIHREWLQHLQWRNPRERWMLKNPPHTLFLGPLREVYPDARLVQTHRDLTMVVSSLASLLETYRANMLKHIDRHALGVEVLHFLGLYLDRARQWRKANPDARVFEVSYRELADDPVSMAQRIYAFYNIPMTEAAETAFQAYVDANPKGKKGVHKHNLASYGLNEAIVNEKFAGYLSEYGDLI